MIAIEERKDLLKAQVFGEFTLADYHELEAAVTRGLKAARKLKLLLDVSQMISYTIDVAWEDLKFTRAHAHDYQRIAIVTSNEWGTWLSWVSAAFTDAEVTLFEDGQTAEDWLNRG